MANAQEHLSDRLRDIDGDGQPDSRSEYIIWLAAFVVSIFVLFWLSFWFSSFIHGFDVLPAKEIASLPKAIGHLVQNPGDPQGGWPADVQAKVAPAWMFWPFAIVFFVTFFSSIRKMLNWWKNREQLEGAHWASDKELDEIIDPKFGLIDKFTGGKSKHKRIKNRMIFGLKKDSGRVLRLGKENHALVVAGTRSGKTAGLCTPAILQFDGAVIATSVKYDLVKDTLRERIKQDGQVWVYDPEAILKPPADPAERKRLEAKGEFFLDPQYNAYWSPLDSCRDWREAMKIANSLIAVSMREGEGGDSGSTQYFKSLAEKVLPVFLHSAAVMDESMRRVLRWINKINEPKTHAEIEAILRWQRNNDAFDNFQNFLEKDPQTQSTIGGMIETALIAYLDPLVQDSAETFEAPEGRIVDPKQFYNGKANTLYIVASPSGQKRLEAVFVAIIESFMEHALALPSNLDTPCIAVLDEAANIAALPKLPDFLSTIGSKGVSIITAWQDFSQIKSRYGSSMNTILSNSRGKMVLSGVSDPETLTYFRDITGEGEEQKVSITRSEHGSVDRNLSISKERRTLLDAPTIRGAKPGEGILVYGHLPPTKIKLKMFFLDNELRIKAGLVPIPQWMLIIRSIPKLGEMIIPNHRLPTGTIPFVSEQAPVARQEKTSAEEDD